LPVILQFPTQNIMEAIITQLHVNG
jgi:hypothetical protein